MKATNKQEFFELLEVELRRIGIEDISDIFADFEEHFTDGAMQGIPEDVTAERLGDIKEIARSYLNLESSRINSIMARDVERRRVSLTKPGREVPADLSLIGSGSARDAANSDNIREYTPQHLSEEIYPQSPNSARTFGNGGNSANSSNIGNNTSANAHQNAGSYTPGGAAAVSGGNGGTGGSENKSVADAFSDAGRAALDAAKITGHAVADAFKHIGVKDAVAGAGKAAANTVKSAGSAVRHTVRTKGRQKRSEGQNNNVYNSAVPRPSDTYRDNMSNMDGAASYSRKAGIPPQYNNKSGNEKKGYRLINASALTPDVNAGKLVVAILLDIFLWSWLLPTIFGTIITLIFGGGFNCIARGISAFFGGSFIQHYFISRLFLGFSLVWLGIAVMCVSVLFVRLFIKLIKFVINLHIKAIYDL